jgi:hypothetical protein
MTVKNSTVQQIRDGLVWSRRTLWQACWSPGWETAEPKVLAVQEELAAAVAVMALDGMPDDYDGALQDVVLWDGLIAALNLITEAITAAAIAPTMRCRALLSQALQQLDQLLGP